MSTTASSPRTARLLTATLVAGVAAALVVPTTAHAAGSHITVTPHLPPTDLGDWYRSPTTATLEVDAPGSLGPGSVRRVQVRDGATTETPLIPGSNPVPVGEGITIVSWRATNPASYVTEAEGQVVVRVDATRPAITLDRGIANDAVVDLGEAVPMDFHCTDNLSGVRSCETGIGQVGSAMLDTSTPGEHNFVVFATDGAGNASNLARRYTVVAPDTTPPAVVVTQTSGLGGGDGWFLTPPTFRLDAADPVLPHQHTSGVDTLDTDLDGVVTEVTTPTTEVTVGPGRHTLRWAARDHAQNAGAVESREVDVDPVDPVTELSYPVEGQHLTTSDSPVPQFACRDELSGVAECAFYREDEADRTGHTRDCRCPEPDDLLTLTPGTHTATVYGLDVAGNASRLVVTYVVDEPVPPAHPVVASATTIGKVVASRRRPGTMTVRITSEYPPSGRVAVYDGQRRIARVSIGRSAARAGRTTLTVRIPRLAKGRHQLRAVYQGAPDIRRSASRPVVVRVR